MDKQLTKQLWKAADNLRANSSLKSQEYSTPVLGLIFLKYADNKFLAAKEKMEHSSSSRRTIGAEDYKAEGVLYLPEKAQYSFLINLSEDEVVGQHINNAMSLIEEHNEDLKGVLPKSYNKMNDVLLADLLRTFNSIPTDSSIDYFGRIYEYFLGKFAMAEGKGGGEFYTPDSLVKLIVNVIEPFQGKIFDPSCGSGGMFVQSANFIKKHKGNPSNKISIYGQEKEETTSKLSKMNMAVHGLSADIVQGNSYYEDYHNCVGKFDFVMANPPFNVDGVKKERLSDDLRFPFGLPKKDNANYLWIQKFYAALNDKGRAGFVMANQACNAPSSELGIRKKIVESKSLDVMITVSGQFFFTVDLPVTLWFFDKSKKEELKDKVLFIDAREIFEYTDRTHKGFSQDQLEFLSNIVRLFRGKPLEKSCIENPYIKKYDLSNNYKDILGICKVVDLDKIKEHKYNLNPGRYVGVDLKLPKKDFDNNHKSLSNKVGNIYSSKVNFSSFIDLNTKKIKILKQLADNEFSRNFIYYENGDINYDLNPINVNNEFLGEKPSDWKIVNLSEITKEIKIKNKDNLDYPVLSVVNSKEFKLSDDYFGTKQVYSESTKTYKIVNKFDIAFNPSRINIGSIAYLDNFENGLISPMYSIIRADSNFINHRILWHVMNSTYVTKKIIKLCFGTTRQVFKTEDLNQIYISLPPLHLQEEFLELTNNFASDIELKNKIL